MFVRSAAAESHENRYQTDRIDRDKDRNKGEQKFFDHGLRLHGMFSLYRVCFLHNHRALNQPNLSA